MEKEMPTKEEVLKNIEWAKEKMKVGDNSLAFAWSTVLLAWEFYLALMEDVRAQVEINTEMWKRLGELKTAHEALKESMEAEYIERQVKHIQGLVKENMALKTVMNNIYANIKNIPAGHERFKLDCIRKLLKPEEKP